MFALVLVAANADAITLRRDMKINRGIRGNETVPAIMLATLPQGKHAYKSALVLWRAQFAFECLFEHPQVDEFPLMFITRRLSRNDHLVSRGAPRDVD